MIRVRFQDDQGRDLAHVFDVWLPESPHVGDVVVFESHVPEGVLLEGRVQARRFFALSPPPKPHAGWPTNAAVCVSLAGIKEAT